MLTENRDAVVVSIKSPKEGAMNRVSGHVKLTAYDMHYGNMTAGLPFIATIESAKTASLLNSRTCTKEEPPSRTSPVALLWRARGFPGDVDTGRTGRPPPTTLAKLPADWHATSSSSKTAVAKSVRSWK
jgi:hypothetical protein